MRLCDRDIEIWLDEGKLVISPRPLTSNIHGATIDVRLGNSFKIFLEHKITHVDLSIPKQDITKVLSDITSNEIKLNEGEIFFLHPGELVLAITLESIVLPNNLIGWLDGRSIFARLGLMIHLTAHRIDPGWQGNIVLECYNSSKLSLGLKPGMLIGALSFEQLSSPATRPYNFTK